MYIPKSTTDFIEFTNRKYIDKENEFLKQIQLLESIHTFAYRAINIYQTSDVKMLQSLILKVNLNNGDTVDLIAEFDDDGSGTWVNFIEIFGAYNGKYSDTCWDYDGDNVTSRDYDIESVVYCIEGIVHEN